MKARRFIVVIVGLALVHSISAAQQIDILSKPWKGERQIVPGRITAAFYDEGGEGIAFHNPAGKNNGSEGIGLARDGRYEVGISVTKPGIDKFLDGTSLPFDKYYVGWIVPGEWLNYSVDVKTTGTYQVNMLSSVARDSTAISLSVDGADKTGTIFLKTTGHVHTWRMCINIAELELEEGPHLLTLKFLRTGFMNVQYLEIVPGAKPEASNTVLTTENQISVPADYKGKPYSDDNYIAGAQVIPGKIECAYYDLGGEGVAYHDFETLNRGAGELNQIPDHQRPHATAYQWNFRKEEAVDISYTKDFADFNHNENYFTPPVNQLYIGWTEDNEWVNYTVDVKIAGTYKIVALYGNDANTINFSINNKPAAECRLPLATGSMHKWNKAEIGTITFSETGLQLLTFHYNKGNNFGCFEFILMPNTL